jgi:hypothetical protein
MEVIFESISIEWARNGVWIIGPTNPGSMTTPNEPCNIAGNPGKSGGHESHPTIRSARTPSAWRLNDQREKRCAVQISAICVYGKKRGSVLAITTGTRKQLS